MSADGALKSRKILLVEDSPEIANVMKVYLVASGAQVDIAQNGKDAIAMCLNQTYDLILMDIQLPGISGLDATRSIRQAGYGGPIIALTSLDRQQDRDACLDAGCDDYLSKPVDRKTLIDVVSAYFLKN